jgi:hypothetical protein
LHPAVVSQKTSLRAYADTPGPEPAFPPLELAGLLELFCEFSLFMASFSKRSFRQKVPKVASISALERETYSRQNKNPVRD